MSLVSSLVKNFVTAPFQYDPETNGWEMLPVTLKNPFLELAAFILDADEIPC